MEIYLALFEVPLILYIGIDLESFPVFMLCFSTKLWLINILISLESTNAYMNKSFNISVVSSEIDRYREVLWALRVLIVGAEEISSPT